jgi:hypothetical protein
VVAFAPDGERVLWTRDEALELVEIGSPEH